MRIPFLWDVTQGQYRVVLDILPHGVDATTVTLNSGIECLRDPMSYLRIE
jgi:hypothetical protein